MRQLKTGAVVLGLFLGGAVVGQAFGPTFIDQIRASKGALPDSGKIADDIAFSYSQKVGDAKSAPQVTQVANEATVQFLYLQSRQNAEIIQLLKDIKAKK